MAMGVPGLWKVIDKAKEVELFTDYVTKEGFRRNQHGTRTYHIGVDASIWFGQCQAAFRFDHAQAGANPELRTIFYRLCHLLRLPVSVLFIFDGNDRPPMKRGKHVGPQPHWLTDHMKDLIDAFGFSWYTAPGEAEAELALLNIAGIVDAVLTNDADAFLFGAKVVITVPNMKDDREQISIYRADTIAITDAILLTRSGMILIALLSGGDYSPGIKGCGIHIAYALARCGFGDTLLQDVLPQEGVELQAALEIWIEVICDELRTNSRQLLGRRYPDIANRLPAEFPSLSIIQLYTQPRTSDKQDVVALQLCPKLPSVHHLSRVCQQLFTFGQEAKGLQKKFLDVVWPGLGMQLIVHEAILHNGDNRSGKDPARFSTLGFPDMRQGPISILAEKNTTGLLDDTAFKIRLTGLGIHAAILDTVDHISKPPSTPLLNLQDKMATSSANPSTTTSLPDCVNMCVSRFMLQTAFPRMVQSYYETRWKSAKGHMKLTEYIDAQLKTFTATVSQAGPSKLVHSDDRSNIDLTQDGVANLTPAIIDLTQDVIDLTQDVIDLTGSDLQGSSSSGR